MSHSLHVQERFRIEEALGSGGVGTVHRAYDCVRNAKVALKLLRHVDPVSLLRFKNEFRSLSTLSHPNLLQLFELVQSGEDFLLSMELVEGSDFLTFVRSKGAQDHEVETNDEDGEHRPQQRRAQRAHPSKRAPTRRAR